LRSHNSTFASTSTADIVCDDEELTTLCTSLKETGLSEQLLTSTWTLFAPTDDAFLKLPQAYAELLTSSPIVLTRLLLFHVVADQALYKQDLPCIAGNNLVEMANGKYSRTLCEKLASDVPVPYYQKGKFNPDSDIPEIVDFNTEACNGVVHKLDGVMLFRPTVDL